MLYRLEIENFYSIRDLQVIDLVAPKSAGTEHGRLVEIGRGLQELAPRVVAIFGAHGSGKSNILRALSFLAAFVKDSGTLAPDQFLPFSQFRDDQCQEAPTRLALWFTGPTDPIRIGEADKQSCKYEYELVLGGARGQPRKVLSETLGYWPLETTRQVDLFQRNAEGIVRAHKVFALNDYRGALEKILKPNVGVVSALRELEHPISSKVWYYATQVFSNISIEKADLNDADATRNYDKMISGALEKGGVAIIDQLDLTADPLAMHEVLGWFYDPQKNPHNAQVWITNQHTALLDHLIKEEIFFCEKDPLGRTEIFGLRDGKYDKNYLSGVYGAAAPLG